MIISRTPLRISFAGGGSDLPSYYEQSPGAVLSTAISKYIYITVNRKFDSKIRASYSVTENVDELGSLRHNLIREALRRVGVEAGIEISSISDIPSSGTGMGSSSSFTVGMLNALHAYTGLHAGAERLAREACHIEIDTCGKPIGVQDQYIAAYGGLQFITFSRDSGVKVEPVLCRPEVRRAFAERLLLLYTGRTRSADSILQTQNENTATRQDTRSRLGYMVQVAHTMRARLEAGDLDGVGDALDAGWRLKREVAEGITDPVIDGWYETARAAGARGGKLLGAGGGGFLLVMAEPELHPRIIAALPTLRAIPFAFEPHGSRIIYVEEEV